jgi:hypothetical protein
MMKTRTSDALKKLSTQKEISTLLHGALTEVRDDIAGERTERQELYGLPVPPEDLADRMRSVLDERRAYLLKDIGPAIVWSMGRPGEKPQWPHLALNGDQKMLELMLLSVALDDIVASVVGAIEYRPGRPMAERAARIEELDASLADLEREEEQLVEQMRASGIQIDHRPDVIERRKEESRAEEYRKHAEQDRLRREELIEKYGDPMALQKAFTARNKNLPPVKVGSGLSVRGA